MCCHQAPVQHPEWCQVISSCALTIPACFPTCSSPEACACNQGSRPGGFVTRCACPHRPGDALLAALAQQAGPDFGRMFGTGNLHSGDPWQVGRLPMPRSGRTAHPQALKHCQTAGTLLCSLVLSCA